MPNGLAPSALKRNAMNIRKSSKEIKRLLQSMQKSWERGYLWSDLTDPRDKPRWKLRQIIPVVLTAMLMGKYTLREMEETSRIMTLVLRRMFGIHKKISDNTIGAVLAGLDPRERVMMLWN